MNRSKWDQRIERADGLAGAHPFAAEVLQFYKRVAMFQQALYFHGEGACGKESGKTASSLLQQDLNVHRLLAKFTEFLSTVETCAPKPMAESARDLNAQGSERWQDLLNSFWRTAPDFQPSPAQPEVYLAWIFLQPQAEYLADHNGHIFRQETLAVCPFCSGKPVVGVLRPEGDGAKRSLICSMCATEWAYGRIICPACGEQAVEKLAIYTASQFDYVRVEACDTCRCYIKTVDLTKNGHAVPIVDELATMPLNLWAQQTGYVKLQANMLGI
jgi:FdhE protein